MHSNPVANFAPWGPSPLDTVQCNVTCWIPDGETALHLGLIPSSNIYPKPASAIGEIPHPSAPSSSLSPTLAGFCIYRPHLGSRNSISGVDTTGLDPARSQCNSLLQLLRVQRKPRSFLNKMGLYPSLKGCSCFWKGENMSL